MIVRDVEKIIEDIAPKPLAWEKDNVGLQVGSPEKPVHKILLTLDLTEDTIDECINKNIDLVISHHPLIYSPMKSISSADTKGKLIFKLVGNNISLISAHTNLDFTKFGVSYALADKLELKNIKVLKPAEAFLKKIIVFVPVDYVEKITEAMALAGAGKIGEYDYCSFRISGIGTFKGSQLSKPFIGVPGELEKVEEIRVEMILPEWKLTDVINAMRASHPYEEPAYDIYPLNNELSEYGAGAIGQYENVISQKKFLQMIKDNLQCEVVKYVDGAQDKIKTVAVCGGSGSSIIHDALNARADAFVTSEISYHSFQQYEGKIMLVDAGHFETEVVILESLANILRAKLAEMKENVQVLVSTKNRNPIKIF